MVARGPLRHTRPATIRSDQVRTGRAIGTVDPPPFTRSRHTLMRLFGAREPCSVPGAFQQLNRVLAPSVAVAPFLRQAA
jgi:hypothetical protein